jgi:hypothetical protein
MAENGKDKRGRRAALYGPRPAPAELQSQRLTTGRYNDEKPTKRRWSKAKRRQLGVIS